MLQFNRIQGIRANDEVAVLWSDDSGQQLVGIARVTRVGPALIQTDDGDFYSTFDGKGISRWRVTQIEPATNDHRNALGMHGQKMQTK
jgi:hypothetical protein